MIDAWVNEGSAWIVESIESQYINISTYRPLSGSSYMTFSIELKHPRKGVINIKNKNQKCFLWCHDTHVNPSKEHPTKILKIDKKLAEKIDYDRTEFLVKEKDFDKIEIKNNICINVFRYENGLVFPIYISNQKFEHSMDLIDAINHIICILMILTDICSTKQKVVTKNGFERAICSVLVAKMF